MEHRIFALVTVYYPAAQVGKNINKISEQVNGIVIADNTPDIDNSRLFSDIKNVTYIYNGENLGLSMAFNKLLRLDMLKTSDFIIFFDQDSEIPDRLVDILIRDYLNLLNNGFKVGCIGPMIYEINLGKEMFPRNKSCIMDNVYQLEAIITSSMLTTYKNLEAIGFWDENIFLDFADWDLCWKFQNIKLLCCISGNVLLSHKLGQSIKILFNHKFIGSSPMREYYQVRDGLKIINRSYIPQKYKKHILFIIYIRPFLNTILFGGRIKRFYFMIMGFIDFFRARNGVFCL